MIDTPHSDFNGFYLGQDVLQALKSVNYSSPTSVQSESIPLILAGIDLIVQSQTGSGKTAAFAIPIIEMLEPSPGQLDVLILAPTRELAQQVAREFDRLSEFKNISTAAIYGGVSYEKQYADLKKAQIVVATPGRLIDLLERKKIDLRELKIFCLDEADEMLSMGFKEELHKIVEYLPEERQSLLYSATITEEIKALANNLLFYPEFVTFSQTSVASVDVTHYYYNVRGVGRARDLIKLLEYEEPDSAIIFANTKDDTFNVTTILKRHGYRVDVLNGDLPQKEREKTLAALRDGAIDFIVATDVAARGIDISELSHVINYTLPDSAEVYIHRTGRTGRAGKKGTAISLVAPTEVATFLQIKKLYDVKFVHQPLPSTHDIMVAKQNRALKQLDEKLSALPMLAYGAKLGIAEQLLSESNNAHCYATMIARLLALADKTFNGSVGDVAPKMTPNNLESPSDNNITSPQNDQPEIDKAVAVDIEKKVDAPQAIQERELPVETSPGTDEQPSVETQADTPAPAARKRIRTRRLRGASKSSSKSMPTAEKSDETTKPVSVAAPPKNTKRPMQKMYLNLGRDKFSNTSEVVDMICWIAGMDPEDIGDISLESTFSFVFVRKDYFQDIVRALHRQSWQGSTITAEPARS